MRLSIVICIYNTDKKLFEECLDSITKSTLVEISEEFEICIVDDGSSTDYSSIAERFKARLKKTANQGIYAARSVGLSMAKGDFVAFCDSDDTVSYDYHLPMLKTAESTGTDIVINDWANKTARACYFPRKDELIMRDLSVTGDEKLLLFTKHSGMYHSFYVLWNKLYRAELLRAAFLELKRIGYPQSSSYAEDTAINFFAWRDAKRIKNIHTGFYFYRLHPSQSVNVTSQKKLLNQIECMALCLNVMRENIGKNVYKNEILRNIDSWAKLMAHSHYSLAKSVGYKDLFSLIKEKYRVSKLVYDASMDVGKHSGNTLLAKNFKEIDSVLFSLWQSEETPSVKFCKSDRYTARCVKRLINAGKAKSANGPPDVVIPKEIRPLRLRLIHNRFIYKAGLLLFKKGSKTREFLKKFI